MRSPETMKSDYFADTLIAKLQTTDPVILVFEAQDRSRAVGFDFPNFTSVVDRALDEIREAKEAFTEEGSGGREHFGDELADIMFSLVNLARHAGIRRPTPLQTLIKSSGLEKPDQKDTITLIDDIGDAIHSLQNTRNNLPAKDFKQHVATVFQTEMLRCIHIMRVNNFDPQRLLTENNHKYLLRCKAIEKLAKKDGKLWSDLANNGEILAYWKKAKKLLRNNHG